MTKVLKVCVCLALIASLMTSCCRSRDDFWEDSKSCSRHVGRGIAALGGKHGNSKQVSSPEEFLWRDDFAFAKNSDFIPLENDGGREEIAMADMPYPQAVSSPGDPGSAIPGIDAFERPENNPELVGLFKKIYFPYNSNLIKGRDNFMILSRIAAYMKKNPNVYVFVEGHCDERGAEAYNLALGTRRANSVRNLLVTEGVSPDRLFTVSYGKEKPDIIGHDEEAWQLNRRGEFRIYRR